MPENWQDTFGREITVGVAGAALAAVALFWKRIWGLAVECWSRPRRLQEMLTAIMDRLESMDRRLSQLEESHARVAGINQAEFDLTGDIMWLCKPNGMLVNVSQGYLDWLRVGMQDLLGRAYVDRIHGRDRKRVMRAFEASCAASERQFHLKEFSMMDADDREHVCDTHAQAVLGRDGEIEFYCGVITERGHD